MGIFKFHYEKAFYYFMIFGVLDFLNSLFNTIILEEFYKAELMIFNFVFITLGELLSGFLVLYTKVKMKNSKKIKKRNLIHNCNQS